MIRGVPFFLSNTHFKNYGGTTMSWMAHFINDAPPKWVIHLWNSPGTTMWWRTCAAGPRAAAPSVQPKDAQRWIVSRVKPRMSMKSRCPASQFEQITDLMLKCGIQSMGILWMSWVFRIPHDPCEQITSLHLPPGSLQWGWHQDQEEQPST